MVWCCEPQSIRNVNDCMRSWLPLEVSLSPHDLPAAYASSDEFLFQILSFCRPVASACRTLVRLMPMSFEMAGLVVGAVPPTPKRRSTTSRSKSSRPESPERREFWTSEASTDVSGREKGALEAVDVVEPQSAATRSPRDGGGRLEDEGRGIRRRRKGVTEGGAVVHAQRLGDGGCLHVPEPLVRAP